MDSYSCLNMCPRVVFLILNYNSYVDTIKLTDELLAFNSQYFDYSILIVDNKSSNDSFKILSDEYENIIKVEVISTNYNGGYAKGNNFGLWYLKDNAPEYVCIINNDVHFSSITIEKLIDQYEKIPDVGIISPIQLLPSGEPAKFSSLKIPSFLQDLLMYTPYYRIKDHLVGNNLIPKEERVLEVEIIPGAFLFVKYKTFKQLEFFDEITFLFCEERFTAIKTKKAGLKNYLIPYLSYIHEHSKTINTEASRLKQLDYLQDGKLKFTKVYRRFPVIKCILLNGFYYLKKFAIKILIKTT